MIKYEDSVKALLQGISQEAVDFWCNTQGIATIKKERFVSDFTDYSREGLASLLTAISNTTGESVTKAADTQPEHEEWRPSSLETQSDHDGTVRVFKPDQPWWKEQEQEEEHGRGHTK